MTCCRWPTTWLSTRSKRRAGPESILKPGWSSLPFGHPSVVVTLGSGGVLHYQDGKLALDLRAPKVQARSTHGAGDHFVGVLAASLAQGTASAQALGQAVASAAEFVQLLHKHALTPVS